MKEQFNMFADEQALEEPAQAAIELSASLLPKDWQALLASEFDQPYMHALQSFLSAEQVQGKTLYPPADQIFTAFNLTTLKNVKVVNLGQDPYHGPGQAHGLCFSVQPGVKSPPSLVNLFKEIHMDLKLPIPNNGTLVPWARQGVLLLNSVLTGEHSKAGAHQGKGWEQFTDKVVELLNAEKRPLVFVLWGKYAHTKGQFIDTKKHYILKAAHPSPFSPVPACPAPSSSGCRNPSAG